MRVPERLRERTLRCLTCGVEFVADPTPAADERSTLRRRMARIAVVACVVAVSAALLWWLGRPQTADVLGTLPGEIVVAEASAGEWIPAAPTWEQARAFAKDRSNAGAEVRLDPGTRLRVLGSGDPARVRVLDGPWTGRVVWVGAKWLRSVPDDDGSAMP